MDDGLGMAFLERSEYGNWRFHCRSRIIDRTSGAVLLILHPRDAGVLLLNTVYD